MRLCELHHHMNVGFEGSTDVTKDQEICEDPHPPHALSCSIEAHNGV